MFPHHFAKTSKFRAVSGQKSVATLVDWPCNFKSCRSHLAQWTWQNSGKMVGPVSLNLAFMSLALNSFLASIFCIVSPV